MKERRVRTKQKLGKGGREPLRSPVGFKMALISMAENRRTISGHASLTDGGAVPWSSRRQGIAPSELLSTESDYITVTHSGKETVASQPCPSGLSVATAIREHSDTDIGSQQH